MAAPAVAAALAKAKKLKAIKDKARQMKVRLAQMKAALAALKGFFTWLFLSPDGLTVLASVVLITVLVFCGMSLGRMFFQGKVPTMQLSCAAIANPGTGSDVVTKLVTNHPPADLQAFETWSAEQVRNAWSIMDVGKQLGANDHAIMIAIAVAMQEQSLNHKGGGDRDSEGIYQQRTTAGWGKIEYILNITYAVGTFYKGPKYAVQAVYGIDPAKGEDGNPNKYKTDLKKEITVDGTTYSPGQLIPWNGSTGLLAVPNLDQKTPHDAVHAMKHNFPSDPNEYNKRVEPAERLLKHITGRDPEVGQGCSGGIGGPNDAACWYPNGLTKTMLDVCGRVYESFYHKWNPPMTKDGKNYGGNCKSDRGANDPGDHNHGRACDFMVDYGNIATGDNKARGDAIAQAMQDGYKELGVCWMSWYGRAWGDWAPGEWRPYHPEMDHSKKGNATYLHYDHVHVSTLPDANKAAGTSFPDCG